jgi:2-polyprenyl-3-methyl-5-hydroxy-6-metoxy-1,4-benzoquinol methylase
LQCEELHNSAGRQRVLAQAAAPPFFPVMTTSQERRRQIDEIVSASGLSLKRRIMGRVLPLLAAGLRWYHHTMRTAADFNQFYAAEDDPWHISGARFRDKALRRSISRFVAGKSVLELGCGEGHLTQSIFSEARTVTGIDISDIAIERARTRNIQNARFESSDFLRVSFNGYDVITAIECLYYLTPEDQDVFLEKVAREHSGKIMILSGPIIGENEHRKYFTHQGLLAAFTRHGIEFHNLNVYRTTPLAIMPAILVRLPLGDWLLDYLPSNMVYQRCYTVQIM